LTPFFSVPENKGVFLFVHLRVATHYDSMISFCAASAAGTASRLWCFSLRAVTAIKPAITFQAESGGRDHFFYGSSALRARAGRGIGKFLAQFKLVMAAGTSVFVHRHDA
jgi:hypothetical protein